MPVSTAQLVERFRQIHREQMRGLPIVNEQLEVEAVGFREVNGHRVGVLVTPWFMNLVLLPGTDEWDTVAQGAILKQELPGDSCEFVVNRDDALGTYLSAILFRTLKDFPGQDMAREIADEVLASLFARVDLPESATGAAAVSRRSLLTGLGAT